MLAQRSGPGSGAWAVAAATHDSVVATEAKPEASTSSVARAGPAPPIVPLGVLSGSVPVASASTSTASPRSAASRAVDSSQCWVMNPAIVTVSTPCASSQVAEPRAREAGDRLLHEQQVVRGGRDRVVQLRPEGAGGEHGGVRRVHVPHSTTGTAAAVRRLDRRDDVREAL